MRRRLKASYVDDLKTLAEESICLIRKMVRDTLLGRRVRLVNVHPADRTAELGLGGVSAIILFSASDCVVEDQNANGSCSVYGLLWGLSAGGKGLCSLRFLN